MIIVIHNKTLLKFVSSYAMPVLSPFIMQCCTLTGTNQHVESCSVTENEGMSYSDQQPVRFVDQQILDVYIIKIIMRKIT